MNLQINIKRLVLFLIMLTGLFVTKPGNAQEPTAIRTVTSLPSSCRGGVAGQPTDAVVLISGGTGVLYWCSSTNHWTAAGGTSPATPNGAIQFDNSGAFGGDSLFTYNSSTHTSAEDNINVTGSLVFAGPFYLTSTIPSSGCVATASLSGFCLGTNGNPYWFNNGGTPLQFGFITQVTAGTGLSGGGTSGNVTMNLASQITAGTCTGCVLTYNAQGQLTAAANGITSIVAGTGLTGGGSSGAVSLGLATQLTAGTCTNCNLTYNAQGQLTIAGSSSGSTASNNPTLGRFTTVVGAQNSVVVYGAAVNAPNSIGSSSNVPPNATDDEGNSYAQTGGAAASSNVILGVLQGTTSGQNAYGMQSWFRWSGKFIPGQTTGCRYWMGLSANTGNFLGFPNLANDDPSASLVGWRYSAGTDTHWQAVVNNSGTQTVTDTGITPDAVNSHLFEITWDGTNYNFWYDNGTSPVAIISTNVPSASTHAAIFWTGDNKNAAVTCTATFYWITLRLK